MDDNTNNTQALNIFIYLIVIRRNGIGEILTTGSIVDESK